MCAGAVDVVLLFEYHDDSALCGAPVPEVGEGDLSTVARAVGSGEACYVILRGFARRPVFA